MDVQHLSILQVTHREKTSFHTPWTNFHKFTSRHTKEIYQDQHLFIFSKNSNSQVLLSFSLGHCWNVGKSANQPFSPLILCYWNKPDLQPWTVMTASMGTFNTTVGWRFNWSGIISLQQNKLKSKRTKVYEGMVYTETRDQAALNWVMFKWWKIQKMLDTLGHMAYNEL